MRTALYRHFDAAGVLLYVGISLNSIKRTAQHKYGAKWFQRIDRITFTWHDTRAAALAAEAIAIAKERPVWNVVRPKGGAPSPPVPQERYAGAVRHLRTGRINGWYFRRDETEHMLGWFRAVFPRDQFELASPVQGGDNYIHRHLELKPNDHSLWAATAPDYAAADAYDEAHA
jgi:excinuclease UvrABC nuclease subunit